jgi:hypothetical protein
MVYDFDVDTNKSFLAVCTSNKILVYSLNMGRITMFRRFKISIDVMKTVKIKFLEN